MAEDKALTQNLSELVLYSLQHLQPDRKLSPKLLLFFNLNQLILGN